MTKHTNSWRIRTLTITSSTNDDAKRAAEAGEAEGLVIHGLKQTSGRGRHGRQWDSPEGNLYCSVLLRPKIERRDFGSYSFAAALALGETVKHYLPDATVMLKWPNDVLVDGKKISGILLEAGEDWLVIGMGLNVRDHPENALYPSTSMFEKYLGSENGAVPLPLREGLGEGALSKKPTSALGATPPHPTSPSRGEELDRSHFNITLILETLLDHLWQWHKTMQNKGFGPLRTAWLTRAQKGRMTVKLPNETLEGEFADLDPQGHLRLRLADGSERVIATGDVFFGD